MSGAAPRAPAGWVRALFTLSVLGLPACASKEPGYQALDALAERFCTDPTGAEAELQELADPGERDFVLYLAQRRTLAVDTDYLCRQISNPQLRAGCRGAFLHYPHLFGVNAHCVALPPVPSVPPPSCPCTKAAYARSFEHQMSVSITDADPPEALPNQSAVDRTLIDSVWTCYGQTICTCRMLGATTFRFQVQEGNILSSEVVKRPEDDPRRGYCPAIFPERFFNQSFTGEVQLTVEAKD